MNPFWQHAVFTALWALAAMVPPIVAMKKFNRDEIGPITLVLVGLTTAVVFAGGIAFDYYSHPDVNLLANNQYIAMLMTATGLWLGSVVMLHGKISAFMNNDSVVDHEFEP